MPRWVKVFIVIGIVVTIAFLVSLFAGVEHGPQRHGPNVPRQHSPPGGHGP